MEVFRTVADLRSGIVGAGRIAFVPTMGNLHAGHVALVEEARNYADAVVASVFVNRLQFGPAEDFDRYPRTFEEDCAQLANAACDFVFVPDESELYPEPQTVFVTPPPIADELEGASRPGHFQGVTTVVAKLFSAVGADVALFGKKDYQQLRVIETMVRQLLLPVEIVACETLRADDGLALSSRNAYLSPKEREEAPQLHKILCDVRKALQSGEVNTRHLELFAEQALIRRGWQPFYIAVREQKTLRPPVEGDALVVLGAARLGNTRLIDNVEV